MPRSFLITNKRYKPDAICQTQPPSHDSQLCSKPGMTHGDPGELPLIWTPRHDTRTEDAGSGKENEVEIEVNQSVQSEARDITKITHWRDEISRDFESRNCSDMVHLAHVSPTRPPETTDEILDYSPEPMDFSIKGRPSPSYDISPTYFPSLFSSVMEEKLSGPKTPVDFGSTYMSDDLVYKASFGQMDYSLNALVEKAWSDINISDTHVCPECGKRYSTSSNLARHRQTHRSMTDKKARKCPHCEKVYVSMPAFSMHVRTHNQGCECPYCGKRFSRPWLLQGHIRTHTGEKPFTCPQCHKAFADKSNLRAHVQTHSTDKPYVCGRCNKAFALKSYLYKHEESSCMRGQHQRLERSYSRSREPSITVL